MYSEDEMLMLSGIQHFRFCPRQWALIHIEQQWEENRLTVEGELLHKHADDPFYRQKCGDYIALRSVNIASSELGLYGIADIVELHPTEDKSNSITHPKYPGSWLPYPIEYKHGKPKKNEIDEVQLAAQAMCLDYGQRVQNSVFECEVTDAQFCILKERIKDIIKSSSDSVRFYHLNRNDNRRVEVLGKETVYKVNDAIVI